MDGFLIQEFSRETKGIGEDANAYTARLLGTDVSPFSSRSAQRFVDGVITAIRRCDRDIPQEVTFRFSSL